MAVEDFVFSNNPEDMDKLHPSLKRSYFTGLDRDSKFYQDLNKTDANSFFKFDLNHMNPEEHDPNVLNRARENSGWKYGWYGSLSSSYELLASIPGGIDRLRDWAIGKFGYEPTQNGWMDKMRDYFDDLADEASPAAKGITPPSGFGAKVAAGFAAAPLTIAQFIPAVRLTKSLTLGTAATEFLRTMDDGNLVEIAKATAMGGVLGGTIALANRMRIPMRMATLATTGFLSAGWKAPLEDRLAAATVWGTLGVLGPVAEHNRSIGNLNPLSKIEKPDSVQFKQLRESVDLKPFETNYNAVIKTQKEIADIKTLLEAHNKATLKDKVGAKLKPEEQQILADNTKARLEEKVIQLEQMIEGQERALYATEEVSRKILGADPRSSKQIKFDLRTPEDRPRYKDMESGLGEKASVFLKPGKFQDHPLMKWVVDKTNIIMKSAEYGTDWLLYDLRQIPTTKEGKKVLFPGKTEKESLNDYFARTDSSLRHLTSYALPFKTKHFVIAKSADVGLTPYENLTRKNYKAVEKLKDASFKIEIDKLAEATKNKESYTTRDKNNNFKYEVKDIELKNKYGFDAEMIKVYREIRHTVDAAGDMWNKAVIKHGEKASDKAPLEKIPNYVPHVFKGDFRVWVNKIDPQTGKAKPIGAYGADSKIGVNLLKSRLKKEKPEYFDETKYNIVTRQIDRSPYEKFEVDAFIDTLKALELKDMQGELGTLQKALYETTRVGFEKFTRKRQGIEGYLGHERGLKGVDNFKEAIRAYVTGAVHASKRLELNDIVNDAIHNAPAIRGNAGKKSLATLYPNATKYASTYKNNATGQLGRTRVSKLFDDIGAQWIGQGGLARVLGGLNTATLQLKLLFGNMRFIAAQAFQPYHMIFPKLVDLQVKGFDKGSIAKAQIKSFRDLFFPNKEAQEAIEYFNRPEVRLVEPKFLREFTSPISRMLPGKGRVAVKGKVVDFNKIVEYGTLQKMSALVEQTSRQNAGMMFFNFLRTAGVKKQPAMENAAWLADKYMVEYNHIERPMIYGEAGMGTAGKPFGLFKTFQHNYLSHLVETIKTAKVTGETAPLAAFTAQMVFAAGLYGVIAYKAADSLIDKLNPILTKYTGTPMPGLTDTILTSSLPMMVKYGVPSGLTGVDFTTTLASPGQSVTDLISVPALDTFGLVPLKDNSQAILPSTFNYLAVAFSSADPHEKRLALIQFYNSISPTSMKVFIEQYYNGLPMGWFANVNVEQLAGKGELDYEHMFAYNQGGPYNNWKKKGRGEYPRSSFDWYARKWAARSIYEQEALKTVYVGTRLKRNLKYNMDTIVNSASHYFMKDGFVPVHLYDMAREFGVLPGSLRIRISNRVDLWNSTMLDRIMKNTKSSRHAMQIAELREIVDSKYFFPDQE